MNLGGLAKNGRLVYGDFVCNAMLSMGWAQTKKLEFNLPKDGLTFTYADKNMPMSIFSFYMSTDTSVLKPLDTSYSSADNIAYQTIRYTFKDGKTPMQLAIKNYYNGRFWRFQSVEIKKYYQFTMTNAGKLQYSDPFIQIAPYYLEPLKKQQ